MPTNGSIIEGLRAKKSAVNEGANFVVYTKQDEDHIEMILYYLTSEFGSKISGTKEFVNIANKVKDGTRVTLSEYNTLQDRLKKLEKTVNAKRSNLEVLQNLIKTVLS